MVGSCLIHNPSNVVSMQIVRSNSNKSWNQSRKKAGPFLMVGSYFTYNPSNVVSMQIMRFNSNRSCFNVVSMQIVRSNSNWSSITSNVERVSVKSYTLAHGSVKKFQLHLHSLV
jgi:hypothetical protein